MAMYTCFPEVVVMQIMTKKNMIGLSMAPLGFDHIEVCTLCIRYILYDLLSATDVIPSLPRFITNDHLNVVCSGEQI